MTMTREEVEAILAGLVATEMPLRTWSVCPGNHPALNKENIPLGTVYSVYLETIRVITFTCAGCKGKRYRTAVVWVGDRGVEASSGQMPLGLFMDTPIEEVVND